MTKNGDDFLELVIEGCIKVEGVFIEDKALKVFELVEADEKSLLRVVTVVWVNKLFILFLLEIVVFKYFGILKELY